MDWLIEQPIAIGAIGLVFAAFCVLGWSQSRSRGFLVAALVTLGITGLLLAIERGVQTEKEQVADTLQDLARAVEKNDIDAVLAFVADDAEFVRGQARGELPRYEFERVDIKSNLEVVIEEESQPRRAEASFNVVVTGSDRDRLIGQRRVPRYCVVHFVKQGDEWRITGYEHHEPRVGLTEQRHRGRLPTSP